MRLEESVSFAPWLGSWLGPWQGAGAGSRWALERPGALACVVLAVPLLWALRRSLARRHRGLLRGSFALRSLAILLASVALALPVRFVERRALTTLVLVDESSSVTAAQLAETEVWLQQARDNAWSSAQLELLAFARQPRALSSPGVSAPRFRPAVAPEPKGSDLAGDPYEETNIARALAYAYGRFPQHGERRLILLSDGQQTRGSLLSEVARAQRLNVPISVLPQTRRHAPEVLLSAIRLPERAKAGQPFVVEVDVAANGPGRGTVVLSRAGQIRRNDWRRSIEWQRESASTEEVAQTLRFTAIAEDNGSTEFMAQLLPESGDTESRNNRRVGHVQVLGRPRVLLIDGRPAELSAFGRALIAQGFGVDRRSSAAAPRSSGELSLYDAVFVSDTQPTALPGDLGSLLEGYIRKGGVFVFVGGAAAAQGGWQGSRIERLLPVRLSSQSSLERPSVAMALLIDRSGSMTGLPLEMAKAACQATVETLAPSDWVEVIAFDSVPRRVVRMQPARFRARIERELSTLTPGGGTAIRPALSAAYQDIAIAQARKKHIIVLTDGRADAESLLDLATTMRAQGITLTTVGLGEGADAELLRRLARAGGGRFHAAPDPGALPRIFTRETRQVAQQGPRDQTVRVSAQGKWAFLRGVALEGAPPLGGYLPSVLKGGLSELLVAGDAGQPVLTRRRLGLGWALAWTSDLKSRWSHRWLAWPPMARFWAQVLRSHAAVQAESGPRLRVEAAGDALIARFDAFSSNGGFERGLESALTLLPPSGQTQRAAFVQVAPGSYEARLTRQGFGTFELQATHQKPSAKAEQVALPPSSARVSVPYPQEFARLGRDDALLREVVLQTGGQWAPEPASWLVPRAGRYAERDPLWPLLLGAALLSWLLDVALRRVPWLPTAARLPQR